jgi:integrase
MRWKAEQAELQPGAHLLRSNKSERLSSSAIWRRWKKYCPLHRLHDARHTNATLLYEATTRSLNLILGLNWEEMTFGFTHRIIRAKPFSLP